MSAFLIHTEGDALILMHWSLEKFWTVWKVLKQSRKFPDSLKSFRQSQKFPDSLESFRTVWNVSRPPCKFLGSPGTFKLLIKNVKFEYFQQWYLTLIFKQSKYFASYIVSLLIYIGNASYKYHEHHEHHSSLCLVPEKMNSVGGLSIITG